MAFRPQDLGAAGGKAVLCIAAVLAGGKAFVGPLYKVQQPFTTNFSI